LLILGLRLAEAVFGAGEKFQQVDWAAQPKLWGQITVSANIGGGDNATASTNNDGIYWSKVLQSHLDNGNPSQKLFWGSQLQVLGLFLQGALLGNEKALSMLGSFLANPSYGPFDGEAISKALRQRGWTRTHKADELVASLSRR
jgi:hypothetical protein